MLTDRELGDIRNTVQDYSMPASVVILEDTGTNDSAAGHIENWTPSGTVAGRVRRELKQMEVELGGAVRSVVPVPISLPWNCGVTPRNRLLVDDVQEFEIIGTDNARSEPGCLVIMGVKIG